MTAACGRRVSDLPGVLGHELRNPLASAVTAVSLLGEMIDPDDPRHPMVERALLDLDRVSALIDGWLRLSRTGAVTREPIEVDALLLHAKHRHGAAIVSDRLGSAIDGDRVLLDRVLDNLLDNARQAGATSLRIAAQKLGDEVSIHVEDDGPGIAENDLPRIFDPGWSGRGGNGLGLHAVAATMRAHGGSISCVRLGKGTRFTLRLPVARLESASA
ncbi:MAG: HAMP domain-containing histidine kinase [Planctomycetes bacterium]|nr:HAMP domain-containing histidine kinase [Planctomycetota bacterium]